MSDALSTFAMEIHKRCFKLFFNLKGFLDNTGKQFNKNELGDICKASGLLYGIGTGNRPTIISDILETLVPAEHYKWEELKAFYENHERVFSAKSPNCEYTQLQFTITDFFNI